MKKWVFTALAIAYMASAAHAWTFLGWGQRNRKDVTGNAVKPPVVDVAVVGGVNPADTSGVPFQMNADGSASFSEASKDRDYWTVLQAFNNQFTASGTGLTDSTGTVALDTHAFGYMALMFYPQFDSLSTTVRLAVQVRGGSTASVDSSSAFPWYGLSDRTINATFPPSIAVAGVLAASGNTALHTAAAAASLGLFSSVPLGSLVSGTGIATGTYVTAKGTGDSTITIAPGTTATFAASTVTFYPQQGAAPAQLDTLGHQLWGIAALAQATSANSSNGGLWSGEKEMIFSVARQDTSDGSGGLGKFGAYPKGIYVPLIDAKTGAPFRSPYTSVRFRVLNGVRSRFRLRVDMIGMAK